MPSIPNFFSKGVWTTKSTRSIGGYYFFFGLGEGGQVGLKLLTDSLIKMGISGEFGGFRQMKDIFVKFHNGRGKFGSINNEG